MIMRREAIMARRLAILGALVVGTLWVASPAIAKGQVVTETVTVSVSGPGLSSPAALHWRGRCPLGFFPCPQSLSDFSMAMSDTGMMGSYPGSFEAPDASKLGPKFGLTVTYDLRNGPTYIVHKDLYPFGPGTSEFLPQRPWLFTPAGQRVADMDVPSGWQPAAPSLMDILRDHGFTVPAPSPAPFSSSASGGAARPASNAGGTVSGWVLAAGGVALGALVGLAAWLGRPKHRPIPA
jgi:hypothetical protein